MNTVVATPWPPGTQRTFYFYAVPAALSSKQSRCLPFRADSKGIVCLRVASQSGVERWRVAVTLVNAGTKTVGPGLNYRFGVQVGPA